MNIIGTEDRLRVGARYTTYVITRVSFWTNEDGSIMCRVPEVLSHLVNVIVTEDWLRLVNIINLEISIQRLGKYVIIKFESWINMDMVRRQVIRFRILLSIIWNCLLIHRVEIRKEHNSVRPFLFPFPGL